eukprot:2354898-Amphidinium_carterae.1
MGFGRSVAFFATMADHLRQLCAQGLFCFSLATWAEQDNDSDWAVVSSEAKETMEQNDMLVYSSSSSSSSMFPLDHTCVAILEELVKSMLQKDVAKRCTAEQ